MNKFFAYGLIVFLLLLPFALNPSIQVFNRVASSDFNNVALIGIADINVSGSSFASSFSTITGLTYSCVRTIDFNGADGNCQVFSVPRNVYAKKG